MYEIHWLGDSGSQDAKRVGGKAANLSLYFQEHRVPQGFVVPALPASWPALPADLSSLIAAAYGDLGLKCGIDSPRVAVRSSALDEDGAGSSFAGQHDTYLNIQGPDALLDAVIRCVHSALSPEALAYRKGRNLAVENVQIAVLVQHLVPADAAAVVFSCNPVTGDLDQVMINANWGLGESIVGGTATPDTFVVHKQTLEVIDEIIAYKDVMTVREGMGTREVDVPAHLQRVPSLTVEQVQAVARMAISLEATTGHPVDVECAVAAGEVYLLQCRPVTTL